MRAETKDGLTRSQETVLLALTIAIQANDIAPTVRELAEACHFSTGTITQRLRELEGLGLIRRDSQRQRHIRLVRGKRTAA